MIQETRPCVCPRSARSHRSTLVPLRLLQKFGEEDGQFINADQHTRSVRRQLIEKTLKHPPGFAPVFRALVGQLDRDPAAAKIGPAQKPFQRFGLLSQLVEQGQLDARRPAGLDQFFEKGCLGITILGIHIDRCPAFASRPPQGGQDERRLPNPPRSREQDIVAGQHGSLEDVKFPLPVVKITAADGRTRYIGYGHVRIIA
jgi:hypothetical protein